MSLIFQVRVARFRALLDLVNATNRTFSAPTATIDSHPLFFSDARVALAQCAAHGRLVHFGFHCQPRPELASIIDFDNLFSFFQ